jgi:hypothetical protein
MISASVDRVDVVASTTIIEAETFSGTLECNSLTARLIAGDFIASSRCEELTS